MTDQRAEVTDEMWAAAMRAAGIPEDAIPELLVFAKEQGAAMNARWERARDDGD